MLKNPSYFLHDRCCLRIPTKPLNSLTELNLTVQHLNLQDHQSVIKILTKLFSDNIFKESIFTASKELYDNWQESNLRGYNDITNAKKLLITLYKYYSRMCTRCTPYGIFAGVTSILLTEEATNIAFNDNKYRFQYQLNIHSVTEVIRNLNPLQENLIVKVKYFVNKTCYILGQRVFFVEQINNGKYLASNLTSINNSIYVDCVMKKANNGATVLEMAESIKDENISDFQKKEFIGKLIKSQLLICEFWPSTSSADYMKDLNKYIIEGELDIPELSELLKIYNVDILDYVDPGNSENLNFRKALYSS